MIHVIAAFGLGLIVLLVWPRWWVLALLAVGYATLFKWPMLADDPDDLIVYMPPIAAWFITPGFLVAGSAIVVLRQRSRSKGEVK